MSHQNINPCWWGSHVWQTIFFMIAVYPEEPSKEEIDNMKCFFRSLKYFLPCEGCKTSYCKFSADSDTKITNTDNFKSRNNLLLFVYNLRNKVNSKLTHEYYINFHYFKEKLNHMRISDNYKYDGRVCDMIEAPFIPEEYEHKVLNHLKHKTKHSPEYTQKLLKISKEFMANPVFDFDNKYFVFLYKRHAKCRKIIHKLNHFASEEKLSLSETWHSQRVLHEKLFSLGCTVIHAQMLKKIL